MNHSEIDKPFHYERVCYYDGTGKFNYKDVKGLPVGFIVGRKCMTKEASLAECCVVQNIIFGGHGYGKKLLNSENPFIFVAIGEKQEQLGELKNELNDITKSFNNSVVIDGFIIPKSK